MALPLVFGACRKDSPLPQIAPLGNFSLIDHDGNAINQSHLRGKPFIANFFFTSCPTACPALTKKMKGLQDQLDGEDVRLISFSVDPEVDTPEKLRAYAKKYGADHKMWTFITGETKEIQNTINKGFRVRAGERIDTPGGGYDIMHAAHFVLVDGEGFIRGYYRDEEEPLKSLVKDARNLAD